MPWAVITEAEQLCEIKRIRDANKLRVPLNNLLIYFQQNKTGFNILHQTVKETTLSFTVHISPFAVIRQNHKKNLHNSILTRLCLLDSSASILRARLFLTVGVSG